METRNSSKSKKLSSATKEHKQETETISGSTKTQEPTCDGAPGIYPRSALRTPDILRVSESLVPREDGYACAACCRRFPASSALVTHVVNGRSQGFSCVVFYEKLIRFWENDRTRGAPSAAAGEEGGERKR